VNAIAKTGSARSSAIHMLQPVRRPVESRRTASETLGERPAARGEEHSNCSRQRPSRLLRRRARATAQRMIENGPTRPAVEGGCDVDVGADDRPDDDVR